ncbi:hypothetical protein N7478_010310 [Penicillium angulare]|uniref:uncharacterized protein n=1 Tax=Penicillium angulare TaxID=116970 RepID=UPI002540C051|nr:uncharacterized protein N7478_010310 [Penicillium angulare]KAJ5267502.1 hypothetical protein N7478_010310 [Penicillium angulare]
MSDAVRPSDDKFNEALEESMKTWSSYLGSQSENCLLPRHAIDLRPLVIQTPPFLGNERASWDKTTSFACEEKQSTQLDGNLLVNGRSTWKTSEGNCDSQPRVMPKQLLLAVSSPLNVRLSEDSPFSDWPGVQGLSGYDQGNYLSVLYLAWAYILSARWVELLGRSADHECSMAFATQETNNSSPQPDNQPVVEIDIGDYVCEEEVSWWRTILFSGDGWDATAKYNGRVYLSPWSASAKHAGLRLPTNRFSSAKLNLPDSVTALKYLNRFCVHHYLYAQCSVALAGVLYIPFLRKRTVSLPVPKPVSSLKRKNCASDFFVSIPNLMKEHSELLPKYMTLSSNAWGLRSLLCSTFFNADIECNLVSAWLNPAFAVLDSIQNKSSMATLLANRLPRLGILWVGAILTNTASSVLRDIRAGMTALDLPASAWTGTTQTFLTLKLETNYSDLIPRDDECRLLFITACEGHDRPPVWPWKPFGFTQLDDTELPVRKHARCNSHCLKYDYWEWILTNNGSIQYSEAEISQSSVQASAFSANGKLAKLEDYNYDYYSQSLSEGATRGIFEWLRSTGYSRNERHIYQHSWLDLEGTDEEEADDMESDLETQKCPKIMPVENWLESIE